MHAAARPRCGPDLHGSTNQDITSMTSSAQRERGHSLCFQGVQMVRGAERSTLSDISDMQGVWDMKRHDKSDKSDKD